MSMGGHHSADEKVCTTCLSVLPIESFSLRNGSPRSQCRKCVNIGNKRSREKKKSTDPLSYRERSVKYNRETRERRGREKERVLQRKYRLKMVYGITQEQFEDMFKKQGNCCAICGKSLVKDMKSAIDHDHSTGVVRGILCQSCNLAIGHMSDSPERLRSAAQYLERLQHGA